MKTPPEKSIVTIIYRMWISHPNLDGRTIYGDMSRVSARRAMKSPLIVKFESRCLRSFVPWKNRVNGSPAKLDISENMLLTA